MGEIIFWALCWYYGRKRIDIQSTINDKEHNTQFESFFVTEMSDKYSFWQFRAKILSLQSIFSHATNIVNAIYYENSLRQNKQLQGFKQNLEIYSNS